MGGKLRSPGALQNRPRAIRAPVQPSKRPQYEQTETKRRMSRTAFNFNGEPRPGRPVADCIEKQFGQTKRSKARGGGSENPRGRVTKPATEDRHAIGARNPRAARRR